MAGKRTKRGGEYGRGRDGRGHARRGACKGWTEEREAYAPITRGRAYAAGLEWTGRCAVGPRTEREERRGAGSGRARKWAAGPRTNWGSKYEAGPRTRRGRKCAADKNEGGVYGGAAR